MKIAVLILFLFANKQPWTLHYACDSGAAETQCHGSKERTRDFRSRIEAINFAESNEQYVPHSVSHGAAEYACWWGYVTADTEGETRTNLAKAVDCDTEENLIKTHCDDDGCELDYGHHEN